MPRISYIDDSRKTPQVTALIESAQKTGAPDPRVVSIMTRSEVGTAWVECWNKVLYKGVLPHKLKEMCRIKISVAHQCGYCSTVRSNVAKGEGLTEDVINELGSYHTSGYFTAREKAALHYADSEEEIIELGMLCAQIDGVGKLVKSFNVLSWGDACALNPKLTQGLAAEAAE